MSNAVKFILYAVLAIIAVSIVVNILTGLLALALKLIVPAAILLGIGYVVYRLIDKKSLGNGPRSIR